VPGWPFPETPAAPVALAEGVIAYGVAQKAEAMGQVRNTYIVAHAFDELIVVDQHAAHEAVLTERLLAGEELVRPSPPARLDLIPREAGLLAGHLGTLADLGLEVEPFGANSFLLRALPASLADQDAPALLDELLTELAVGRDLDPDALRKTGVQSCLPRCSQGRRQAEHRPTTGPAGRATGCLVARHLPSRSPGTVQAHSRGDRAALCAPLTLILARHQALLQGIAAIAAPGRYILQSGKDRIPMLLVKR
jgi:hypothetical protein